MGCATKQDTDNPSAIRVWGWRVCDKLGEKERLRREDRVWNTETRAPLFSEVFCGFRSSSVEL